MAGDGTPSIEFENAPVSVQDYQGGRGLLTIQGPTGLFINPTSGTMPAHAFTLQYCFWTDNDEFFRGLQQGVMGSYGVTDWLEVGGLFTDLNVPSPGHNLESGGPFARVRLLKDEGWLPELSIGGYSHLGDEDISDYDCFLALYKGLVLDRNGFFRSVGFDAGIRETWAGPEFPTKQPVGYFGIEFQMPYHIYLMGEISTEDANQGNAIPYAFGVQFREGIINCTVAFDNQGNSNQPSFYFGIGPQYKF
ncbi:MAG TPA: hypothetical protein VHY22_10985 [Chthoniobacteraceae bacterium]|nr:hypothetical protein [Chthoniobacteraceae bacterium]